MFTTNFFMLTSFQMFFFQIQAGYYALIILFILLYTFDVLFKRKSIKKTIAYFLVLLLIIPLYGAYRANVEFGQPYVYGLLSLRSYITIGIGIWFYYVLTIKKISFPTIETSLLLMAWLSLLAFTFIVITFDLNELTTDNKLIRMTENRGLRYFFQNHFIIFGAVYYFIKYSLNKKLSDFFILLFFLTYIVFVIQGRTNMIYLAVLFLYFYFINFSLRKFLLSVISMIFLIICVSIFIQFLLPGFLENLVNNFSEMFAVLLGEESNDSSSNARVWTSLIVLDFFDNNPLSLWLGTGRISNQWNGGYESFFGYFYPADIGLLGGLFVNGVIGMIFLFIIPLIMTIKEIKKVADNNNLFIMTIKYMLILSIIKFAQTGLYIEGGIWIVYFFILYAYNRLIIRCQIHEEKNILCIN